MKATPIMCKGKDGKPVPLFNSGVRFADGSLSADIPMKSLARQFNITHFIISQV
jgi:predicted acylesterase/phospholipase RssA